MGRLTETDSHWPRRKRRSFFSLFFFVFFFPFLLRCCDFPSFVNRRRNVRVNVRKSQSDFGGNRTSERKRPGERAGKNAKEGTLSGYSSWLGTELR